MIYDLDTQILGYTYLKDWNRNRIWDKKLSTSKEKKSFIMLTLKLDGLSGNQRLIDWLCEHYQDSGCTPELVLLTEDQAKFLVTKGYNCPKEFGTYTHKPPFATIDERLLYLCQVRDLLQAEATDPPAIKLASGLLKIVEALKDPGKYEYLTRPLKKFINSEG